MRALLLAAALACVAGRARAATYYVSPTGSDAAAGTQASPFKTVAKGMSALAAGDTLYLRAGTYAETFFDGMPSGTSWTSPTTIAAYPGETVTIQPASGAARVFTFATVHYVVLDHLILDARNCSLEAVKITGSGGQNADHIRIQYSEVMNSPAQGIYTDAASPSNEFRYDKVHDNGISDFDHGLYIDGSYNVVDHCEVYRNAGWGVHVYNGYAGGHADGNVVSNNRLHDNARLGNRGPGLILSSGQGNVAYNNLIWNNAGGIQVDYGATGSKLLNNTIYNNNGATDQWGIYLGSGQGGTGAAASGSIVQNNVIYNNNGGAIQSSETGTTISNNVTANPLFANASGGDFHLGSGSPAIDVGLNLAGQGVATDIDGTARPQGAAYDAGAYEAGAAAPAPAPTPVVPAGCTLGSPSGWANVALSPQTGQFTLSFDATPSQANMDGLMGASNGAASDYTQLAAIVRFNNAGTIDARNGSAYAAGAAIPYLANQAYHFRLLVNVPSHVYSVYVTPPGGTELLLGANYAFRTEQAAATSLSNLGLQASTGGEVVCKAAATAALPPGCTLGGPSGWANVSLPLQAGQFTVQFDATPSQSAMDGLIGLSNGAASDYTSLATIVRFNSGGTIDARNGGAYAAATAIPYTGGLSYHFRLVVNVTAHTYSAYVRQGGGVEQLLGSNYAFRTEQAAAAALSNLALNTTTGNETMCNAAEGTPPLLTGVSVSNVTATGATINWTSSVAGDSAVDYGTTSSYGSASAPSTALVTSHSAALSGLVGSTTYHYRARTTDAAGNLGSSPDATFQTAAAPVTSGGCATEATGAWLNVNMGSRTGGFTVSFDATPSQAGMDGVIGLSAAATSNYNALAAAVRFSAAGKIEAYNGSGYSSVSPVTYAAGQAYHFRLVLNMGSHTYTAYVTPPGASEILVGSNYAFRTGTTGLVSLSNIALISSTGSDKICNAVSAGTIVPLK